MISTQSCSAEVLIAVVPRWWSAYFRSHASVHSGQPYITLETAISVDGGFGLPARAIPNAVGKLRPRVAPEPAPRWCPFANINLLEIRRSDGASGSMACSETLDACQPPPRQFKGVVLP